MAATGATALAGCSNDSGSEGESDSGSESSGDSGPEYEDVTVEDLVLSESAFPSGWTRDDSINENLDAGFVNADRSIVVLIGINIHETVDEAKEDYEQSVNEAGDINELDIGDEAFWAERNQFAGTLFRDSNVEAQVIAGKESAGDLLPAISRSQDYARDLYDHMQSV
jgi:hypothetical protein